MEKAEYRVEARRSRGTARVGNAAGSATRLRRDEAGRVPMLPLSSLFGSDNGIAFIGKSGRSICDKRSHSYHN